MFKPIKKKSLSNEVYEQIRDQILSGQMKAGDTLPSERILCEQFGVNRGAIREAIKRLEQAQLIRVQHGGGTKILDYRNSGGIELLPALLMLEGNLNPEVIRGVMELRAALGKDIARLCTMRASEELLGDLAQTIEDMSDSTGDLPRLEFLTVRFWDLLVEGSDNIAYRLAYNALRNVFAKLRSAFQGAFSAEWQDLSRFQRIYDAMLEKDIPKVQEGIEDLLTSSSPQLINMLVEDS